MFRAIKKTFLTFLQNVDASHNMFMKLLELFVQCKKILIISKKKLLTHSKKNVWDILIITFTFRKYVHDIHKIVFKCKKKCLCNLRKISNH